MLFFSSGKSVCDKKENFKSRLPSRKENTKQNPAKWEAKHSDMT